MMNTFVILLALMLRISISRAYCPEDSVFTSTEDGHFTLNTSALCQDQDIQRSEESTICDIGALNRFLTIAQYHIREAIDEFDGAVLIRRSMCAVHSRDMHISSGVSLASTLRNGLALVSELTLNMTIAKCHQHSNLEASLVQPMQTILCEMKRLTRDLVLPGTNDTVDLHISITDRTDHRFFTCKNLRRAHILLHDFKRDVNHDVNNVPMYSNGD